MLSKKIHVPIGSCLALAAAIFTFSIASEAATLTVTRTVDTNDGVCSSDCSLREAIAVASSGDTIVFSSLFDTPRTIALTLGELVINKNLTIAGKGARLVTVQRNTAAGTPNFRVFNITGNSNGVVNLSGLTIANGNAVGVGTGEGGGIYTSNATVNLNGVWIRSNNATNGGGIRCLATGAINLINSTVSQNGAFLDSNSEGGRGGGLDLTGAIKIANSTISNNQAVRNGGGIASIGGLEMNNVTINTNLAPRGGGISTDSSVPVRVRNTIIAQNVGSSAELGHDAYGSFASNGNNLIGNSSGSLGFVNGVNSDKVGTNAAPLNPQLGALQNNGGETDTRMLLSNSPAIDAGNNCVTNSSCPSHNPPSAYFLDQRGAGFPRQFGGSVDIGAIEAGTTAVINPNDSGVGSLRQAIADTSANGVILIRIPAYAAGCDFRGICTVNLTTGELAINKSLDIRGQAGARWTIIQRSTAQGTPNFRLFNVTGAGTIFRLKDLTVTNGNAGGNGGAIQIGSGATLSLDEVAVTDNIGSAGGAIINFGDLFIEGSTLSGNHGTNDSGAIRNNGNALIFNSTLSGNRSNNNGGAILDAGTLTLINTTISGNTGNVGGGVFKNSGGALSLRNTIIAANFSGNGGARTDVFGAFTSHGNNLIGNNDGSAASFPAGTPNANADIVGTFAARVNPQLGALGDNGGGTNTHMVLLDSPALNSGNNCVVTATCPTLNVLNALTSDQRNVATPRQIGAAVDIGAFELRVENITNTNDSGAGSLRQTIITTPPGTILNFNYSGSTPGCAAGVCTINLTSGALQLNKSVTIIGPGARNLIIRRSAAAGTPNFTVFVLTGGVFDFSGLTIAGGSRGIYVDSSQLNLNGVAIRDNHVADAGGGMFIQSSTVNILNSAILNNSAAVGSFDSQETSLGFGLEGGGIYNSGSVLNIANTIISGNVAGSGGGITNGGSSSLTLNNVTISHNQVFGVGGGLSAFGSAVSLRNTVIAKNIDTDSFHISPDVSGGMTSLGNNLIGDNAGAAASFPAGNPNANGDIVGTTAAPVDPLLGTLQNNGGQTDTRALAANSPARNAGNNCVTNLSCPANNPPAALVTDQRGAGFPRLSGGFVDIGSFEALSNPPRSPFDFDGDGKTDIGIFRPAAGEWWINRSSTGATFALQFGASTDRIVPADYTGDGKADIAFFRPSTSEWYILRSENLSFYSFPFGANGDIPAPADYDGDGKADPAVFRPSNGTWFIVRSSDNQTTIQQFGGNGDKPVAADYDGDGRADLAIYRPSNGQWWLNRSTAGVIAMTFGNATDKAIQGDYTGDGKADVGFWRPSTSEWYILRSEDMSYYSVPFGLGTDVPAPGDYDGDGKFDLAVFRPSSATWFLHRSTAGTLIQPFGANGDRPVANAFVP